MQNIPEKRRETDSLPGPASRDGEGRGDSEGDAQGKQADAERETLMMELTRLVQKSVRESSWWEKRGIDCTILTAAFISLPAGFLLLGSSQLLYFLSGLLIMGVAHAVITVKGAHLASHGALSESPAWADFWAVFFIEVCGSFSARAGVQAHVKMHHAHTNVIGLGDSSTWKMPFLPRSVYLFIAPLAVPIITPVVAVGQLKGQSPLQIARTVVCVCVGFLSQYYLLRCVSGLSCGSALMVMLLCRAMFSVTFIHVNIFQHIGLPMFSASSRPKRIYQMTHGVLNLPRNPLLDWTFGHSLINCHIEHHLFPFLSDNMCLKVKPIVSQYLKEKQLPYQEDGYVSRLRLFFHRYQELMVFAPPITELVGVQ
ncbi:fatty acid desaturase 6 [Megalobrama amblycephala]|uniref:fatty acid desaturase 6 n=1 Tax=Megalobrama amblycephala TaxID=75352 RepID=UPI0020145FB7|nr:fatty acid desaturase 6 [Megalobrama amblycephala]